MASALCPRKCDVGYFCDPGTHSCETCASICDPRRDTMDECHNTQACRDWSVSSTVSTSLVSPTSTVVSSESSKVILCTVTIVGSIIALILIVALIYRWRRKNSTFLCWKPLKPQPPVPLSRPEQWKTKRLPDGGNPYLLTLLLTNSPGLSTDGADLIGQRVDVV